MHWYYPCLFEILTYVWLLISIFSHDTYDTGVLNRAGTRRHICAPLVIKISFTSVPPSEAGHENLQIKANNETGSCRGGVEFFMSYKEGAT